MAKAKKEALGRGLGSLLGATTEVVKVATEIGKLKIKDIETNPYQPRKDFDEESLAELADSIRQQGVITPITVRRLETGKYQLIAGERRLRAAKMAKLTEIPAYIRTATDQQMMEMAIVENVQRENLNAMEIALSYSTLIEECGLTQEQLSEKVGKNRSTITNYLRLLKLPAEVQIALKDNTISMAHARAMITLEDADIQLRLLKEIINNDLSVRQTESLAKSLIAANSKPAAKKSVKQPLPELHENTKQELKKYIQSEVEIKRSRKGKGSLTIYFNNDSDFQRIVKIIQNK
ncbi:MAG: ParB/RepB/Spo0J family partition protein [Bacteroidales bacterium]|nr:ParB/RepB/Spo0J family partition protein [Bacteroidales bacterium]MBP5241966.1 ParB/RepB/Spo0J family partition protein [Bacteroidales bacterium]MBP5759162.1 ParB/RepB/Spo0J family partition protein [Bacteroidales bacterium]